MDYTNELLKLTNDFPDNLKNMDKTRLYELVTDIEKFKIYIRAVLIGHETGIVVQTSNFSPKDNEKYHQAGHMRFIKLVSVLL